MNTFTVSSGKIRATDPCYEVDVWCAHTIDNVKNGTWYSYQVKSNEGLWGERTSELSVIHSDYIHQYCLYKKLLGSFGVDSGQFGFFDDAEYRALAKDQFEYEPNTFYGIICDQTLDPEDVTRGLAMVPFGTASRSGFGDGTYPVFAAYNSAGEIIALKAVYISDEEEEGYFNDEEEEVD